MGYKTVTDLGCDQATALGGKDKEGNKNPTEIEGYFLGSKKVANPMSKTGFSSLHVFQTEDGNIGIWGKVDLDIKLAAITPGVMTKATFVGTKDSGKGKKPMYVYEVQYDDDNTIDVTTVAPTQEASAGDTSTNDEEDAVSDEDDDDSPAEDAPPPKSAAKRAPATTPTAAAQSATKRLLNNRGLR